MENMKYGTFSMSNFPNIMMSSASLLAFLFKLVACLYSWQGCALQIMAGMGRSQQGNEGHGQRGRNLILMWLHHACHAVLFCSLTMTTV